MSLSKEKFFSDLYLFIDYEAFKLKRDKSYLTYDEFKVLTGNIRASFSKFSGRVPREIEVSCQLAEAVIAPSKYETIKILKNVFSLSGGIGGMSLIIAGVGAALGWGSGIIATVTAFFVGTSMVPIIGQIAGGVALIGIATYFFLYEEPPEAITEKSINAIKEQIRKVEDSIWNEYGVEIIKIAGQNKLFNNQQNLLGDR